MGAHLRTGLRQELYARVKQISDLVYHAFAVNPTSLNKGCAPTTDLETLAPQRGTAWRFLRKNPELNPEKTLIHVQTTCAAGWLQTVVQTLWCQCHYKTCVPVVNGIQALEGFTPVDSRRYLLMSFDLKCNENVVLVHY